jgi:hypothetical protein
MNHPTALADGDELAFAGLHGQLQLLARGDTSSRELVELSLARIEATQPTLNAFRCTRAEAARNEADEADRRLEASARRCWVSRSRSRTTPTSPGRARRSGARVLSSPSSRTARSCGACALPGP